MRIMIDTNVLISAVIKQGSVPDLVLNYVCDEHELVLCDYLINEAYEVANRKFPQKIAALNTLFAKLRYEIVPTPRISEMRIRDLKDQPILNAAINANVDILISGDRHFLELTIDNPIIMNPSKFAEEYI